MGRDKKHKKKHKKEKKRKKRSSSSESSEEEWIEKDERKSVSKSENVSEQQARTDERGDWMDMADQMFSTISRSDLRSRKESKEEKKPTIEELGQSDRELNPYWKDGGTGLPTVEADRGRLAGSTGDMGLDWLKRALARIKERAAEENKSIEEIASQTWGSLDNLNNLIKEAERKADDSRRHRHYKDRSPDDFKSHREKDYRRQKSSPERKEGSRYKSTHQESSRGSSQFQRPQDDYRDERDRRGRGRDTGERGRFRKPADDDLGVERSKRVFLKPSEETDDHRSHAGSSSRSSSSSYPKKTGWKRESASSACADTQEAVKPAAEKIMESEEVGKVTEEKPEILSKEEMNKLGAQIIKAEMLGNEEQVVKLKERLAKAQAWLAGDKSSDGGTREVILTKTDARGFTRPVNAAETKYSKAKRSKVETHQDGKRVRYFADDDRHSLNDLFQKEKFVSASDENEIYSRLAAKGVGRDDSHRDMEDVFEETARVDKGDEWYEFKERQRAVLENDKREKALDKCQWCIGTGNLNRQLVVSVMEKVYLTVPPYGSITEGHCLIIPNQHIPCSTLLDEDVWEEVMDLRKILVKMFLEDDKDILFFENVQYFRKFPHMVLHCVPVPREIGDVAPIYFKKAIMECEMEWSNNKKVVDLKGRDVRKAVPKGLPYFFVDFGMQSGYAHVIEDEQLFPRNFAEEIIGGMMDLDHDRWRKQKKDNPEILQKKAQALIKQFKAFMEKK